MDNNSRRYILERTETRQSGTTTVTTVTTVLPTLIDSFSGNSFSYSGITTAQLAAMEDAEYTQRANDYLLFIGDISLERVADLMNDSMFYDPSCTTPVYITSIVVSCDIPPPLPTGGSNFQIQSNFNSIESFNIYNVSGGSIYEDNKRVYDITVTPLAISQTFTFNFNYELAVSILGSGSDYTSSVKILKNSVQIHSYNALSGNTEESGNATFTITNTDTIKIILEAKGHKKSLGTSDGGAISTIEITGYSSTGSGLITNPIPMSFQSARVGVYS